MSTSRGFACFVFAVTASSARIAETQCPGNVAAPSYHDVSQLLAPRLYLPIQPVAFASS